MVNDMIEIIDLTFKYDNKVVLENVNLSFEKGHIYGVVGANGAGKTTLLNCLGNIFHPNTGEILVENQSSINNLTYLKNMFLLNDNTHLDNNTVITLASKLAKIKGLVVDYAYLSELLDKFEFDRKIYLSKMSKGNKKLAFLIAVLAIKIQVLILDEFLDGIDLVNRSKMKVELLNYSERFKPVIIIASHTISDISDVCDRVVLVKDNKIKENYEIDDLRGKYVTYQMVLNDIIERDYFERLGLDLIDYRNFENIYWLTINNTNEQLEIIESIKYIDLKIIETSLEEVIYNEFKIY